MNQYHFIYKVPAGKLLRVFVSQDDDKRICEVKLTGDFFIYPEAGIEQLEECLRGKPVDRAEIQQELNMVINEQKLELFGLHAAGIADAIVMAIVQGGEKT